VGEDVLVVNNGSLTTHNIRSYGIMATSGGGGGGNGGFSVAGSLSVSPKKSMSVDVSVGGAGGPGNTGGDVTVLNRGRIETFEENSHSVFAQSVGGKGGNGGFSVAGAGAFGGDNLNIAVSVGGSGGASSTGGKVTVTNEQDIVTHEGESYGVFAQSIGGGGGNGGASFAASATFYEGVKKEAKNVNLDFAFGGSGGSGNEGGEVTVNNDGLIHTMGINAHGIFAQSIGGGGGQGGSARTMSLIASPCLGFGPAEIRKYRNPLKRGRCAGSAGSFNLSLGGEGDKGGHGGAVTITNTRDITTEGVDSHGIWAQSVGAGGGSGGEAAHGWFGVPLPGLDAPPPYQNLSLSIGGSAGASGHGGGIEIRHQSGKISTAGDGSFGIYAQSVGGGGGQGGHGVPDLLGTVAFGGKGGSSGNGGAVTVNLGSETETSDIETSGNDAHGIYAQSVGGGGGLAGNIKRGLAAIGLNFGIGVGITKNGGNAGDGGEVTVTSFGNITTKGQASMGIFAQSVGGGGGLTGEPGTGFAIVGSAGGNGTAKKVTVNHTGNITTGIAGRNDAMVDQLAGIDDTHVALLQENGIQTIGDLSVIPMPDLLAIDGIDDSTALEIASQASRFMRQGDNSHGIFVQSGGGVQHDVDILDAQGNKVGVLPGSVSRGGDVEVSVDGNVTAYGTDANGIYVNSQGGSGNGDIDVTVKGIVQGGSGSSVGINIQAGANNVLKISADTGTVKTAEGLMGLAIMGTGGHETVNNAGTVTGLVDLGTGSNAFNNLEGGRLNAGGTVDLGAGNPLNNHGRLSPGGADQVMTTSITGNLVQTSSGSFVTDLDLKNKQADRINVSGVSALDGTIEINRVNSGLAVPGTSQLTILSSAGDVSDRSGLELAYAKSAVTSYELLYPDEKEVVLSYVVDYDAPGKRGVFNRNRSAFGKYVNAVQKAGGSPDFAPLAAELLSLPDSASLGRAYDQLIPESLGSLATETTAASVVFNNAMHSCRQQGGEYRFVREGECRWMRVDGVTRDQDDTSRNPGYQLDAFSIAGGMQHEIAADIHLGYGVSFQHADLDASLTDSDGNQIAGGIILKRRYNATMVSGSVSAGYGWYDTERDVGLPGPGVSARSDQEIFFGSIHGRVSRDFQQGANRYIRPLVDLGVTQVHRKGFNEKGAGAANLEVDSDDDTLVTLQPAIEFGGEFRRDSGTLVRPYARIGATRYLTDNKRQVTAGLEGAPDNVAPFTIETESDRTYADLSLGVDVIKRKGTNARVEYTGQFSDDSSSHAAAVKLYIPF
jgi:hypothetical protein